MHFPIENDFTPKAGEKVLVEGYSQDFGEIAASVVTLPDQDKTLQLRDSKGTPLWRSGRYGRRHVKMEKKEKSPE